MTITSLKIVTLTALTLIMVAIALLASPKTSTAMGPVEQAPLVEVNDQVSRIVMRTHDLSRFSMQEL